MHQATSSCSVLPMTLFGSGGANTQLETISDWSDGAVLRGHRAAAHSQVVDAVQGDETGHRSLVDGGVERGGRGVGRAHATGGGDLGVLQGVSGFPPGEEKRDLASGENRTGLTAWPAIRAAAATRAEANMSTVDGLGSGSAMCQVDHDCINLHSKLTFCLLGFGTRSAECAE
jgi:hypothetical protein